MTRVSLILAASLALCGVSAEAAPLLSARVGDLRSHAAGSTPSAGLLNVTAATGPASADAATGGVNANVGVNANAMVGANAATAPTPVATTDGGSTATGADAGATLSTDGHHRRGDLLRVRLGDGALLNLGAGTSTPASDGSVACTVCLSASGGVGQ